MASISILPSCQSHSWGFNIWCCLSLDLASFRRTHGFLTQVPPVLLSQATSGGLLWAFYLKLHIQLPLALLFLLSTHLLSHFCIMFYPLTYLWTYYKNVHNGRNHSFGYPLMNSNVLISAWNVINIRWMNK